MSLYREYPTKPLQTLTKSSVSSEFGGNTFALGNEDVGYTFYIGGRRNDDLALVLVMQKK